MRISFIILLKMNSGYVALAWVVNNKCFGDLSKKNAIVVGVNRKAYRAYQAALMLCVSLVCRSTLI